MAEYLPESLRVFFSDDINIKICANPLSDNFRSNYVIFLFFLDLSSGSELILQAIYDVPDFSLFKHGLHEVDPLGPILKTPELLSFAFVISIFTCHCIKEEKG